MGADSETNGCGVRCLYHAAVRWRSTNACHFPAVKEWMIGDYTAQHRGAGNETVDPVMRVQDVVGAKSRHAGEMLEESSAIG